MTSLFVAHYAEVALKGNNRPEFVRMLRRNLNRSLAGLDHHITLTDGRFLIEAEAEQAEVGRRISKVFGVAWYASVAKARPEYGEIESAVVRAAKSAPDGTFGIMARRSDKSFPMNSQELASRLGAEVVRQTARRVDLSDPDVRIHVDVTKGGALVYSDRSRGPGGLPLGTAGRVMQLFSGGIDSPVAAWLMMKRGSVPVYVHFYLAPTPRSAVDSKITELMKVLSEYGGRTTLVLVPFAEYQLATAEVPGELEPSLFRRFMRMTAEALAPRFGAEAVSTGDSLSQAASQTLWNIGSFDQGSSLPVLRPLLTYDKDEIIDLARRIGTYDISLKEYKDCCAMITRHPRTRVKGPVLDEYIDKLALRDLVSRTTLKATLVAYNPLGGTVKVSPLEEKVPVAQTRGRPRADP